MNPSSVLNKFLLPCFVPVLLQSPAFAHELYIANETGAESQVLLRGAVQKHVRHGSKGKLKNAEPRADQQTKKSLEGESTTQLDLEENSINWNKWRNRVHKAIWARFCRLLEGGDAIMLGNTMIKLGNAPKPHFPLGTEGSYSCTVSNDRQLLEAKITRSSGNKAFDEILLKSVRSISEKSMLRFPDGSKRQKVTVASSLFTTKQGRYVERDFGDVEKIAADTK